MSVEDKEGGDAVSVDKIDTSNWKTYRNEEYGFEVKYPEEWMLEEFISGAGADQGIACEKISEVCYFSIGFLTVDRKKSPAIRILPKNQFEHQYIDVDSTQTGSTLSGLKYSIQNIYDAMLSSCISLAYFEKLSHDGSHGFLISETHDDQVNFSYDTTERNCSKKYEDAFFLDF